jgi:hypothetical protein
VSEKRSSQSYLGLDILFEDYGPYVWLNICSSSEEMYWPLLMDFTMSPDNMVEETSACICLVYTRSLL